MSDAPESIEDMRIGDLADAITETKKTFSLGTLLETGAVQHRQERVLIYLNLKAQDAWLNARANTERAQVTYTTASKLKGAQKLSAEKLKELHRAMEIALQREEELHAEALSSAISIRLIGVPDDVSNEIEERVRAEFTDSEGKIPAEKNPQVKKRYDQLLVCAQVAEITNSEGARADDLSEEMILDLLQKMGTTNRNRLVTSSQLVQFQDQTTQAALLEDAGF